MFAPYLCHSGQTHRFRRCSSATVGALGYPETTIRRNFTLLTLLSTWLWYPYNIICMALFFQNTVSSTRRQKVLTGYCFKYIDRPFCLRTDGLCHACFITITLRRLHPGNCTLRNTSFSIITMAILDCSWALVSLTRSRVQVLTGYVTSVKSLMSQSGGKWVLVFSKCFPNGILPITN